MVALSTVCMVAVKISRNVNWGKTKTKTKKQTKQVEDQRTIGTENLTLSFQKCFKPNLRF